MGGGSRKDTFTALGLDAQRPQSRKAGLRLIGEPEARQRRGLRVAGGQADLELRKGQWDPTPDHGRQLPLWSPKESWRQS